MRPLIMFLRALGKEILLPVVDFAAATPTLRCAPFLSEASLKPNRWGILEPAGGRIVDRSLIDAVIVPALAADQRGMRLGYGGGYYDAFLADLEVVTVCPVFDACVYNCLQVEPHDIPVSILVTETRTVRCGSDNAPPHPDTLS